MRVFPLVLELTDLGVCQLQTPIFSFGLLVKVNLKQGLY
jgi:hypothetical protein